MFWLPVLLASAATDTSTQASEPVLEVKVRARAIEPGTGDPSASRTRIGPRAIRGALSRGVGLTELVDAVAGARVLDLGNSGQRLSIRGGAPSQVLVVVDGVALSSPFSTGLELSAFDLESVRQIEVVRGGAGAAYGEGALAGVLSIDTLDPGYAEGRVGLTFGSFDTVEVRGAARASSVAVSGAYRRSGGEFEYTSRLPGLPDREAVRLNNDVELGSLGASIERAVGPVHISLSAQGGRRAAGVPGLETQPNLTAREQRDQLSSILSIEVLRDDDEDGVVLSADVTHLGIDYEDASQFDSSETSFQSFGFEGRGDIGWTPAHHTSVRGALRLERGESTEFTDSERGRAGLGVAHEVSLSAWTLFAALRGDVVGDSGLQLSPRAGARLELDRELAAALRLGGGRAFRAPTLDELFHPPEAGIEGNPDLIPESAWELEAAFEIGPRVLSAELVGFFRQSVDTIVYVNRNAFVIRPENVGAARAAGLELSLDSRLRTSSLELESGLSGSVAYSELEETGERLPAHPFLTGAAAMTARPAAAPLELSTRVRALSGSNADLRGSVRVEPYLRWDASLRYIPDASVSLALVFTNLLDSSTLESVHKIPLPGRTVMFTVRAGTERI